MNRPDEYSLTATDFRMILVSSDDSINLTASFTGGNPKYDYDPVTSASPAGVIGLDENFSFEVLYGEPNYPPLDRSLALGKVLLVAILSGFSTLMVGIALIRRMFTLFVRDSTMESEPPETLYDVQKEHEIQTTDVTDERPQSAPQSEVETDPPESPYDVHQGGYL
jgi:hypothetical protein